MINKFPSIQTPQTFIYDLIRGAFISILFSAFIYLEYFGFTFKLFNTLFALSSLALLLYTTKRTILIAGFFIGLLWFYWIGYSFKYQGVGYMTPIITIAFGFIYMLFFGVLALTKKVYIRAVLLFSLSFFEPFDWNWLQIELLFVESYIGIFKYQLFLVLLALSLPNYLHKPLKFVPLIFIFFALNFQTPTQELSSLKIKLIETNIKQEDKWKTKELNPTLQMVYTSIKNAIKENYDVIVFPESVFPLYMNKYPNLLQSLQKASTRITIVAGSLLRENNNTYNVTYIFNEGKYTLAKKMVLVPFGEYVPLPEFAQKIINDTFFSGNSDFIQAKEPTDFKIKGETFRNAICYEATCQEIYEGDVKFVIATSNNAWFTPSIEPTIQNLLLRYYARKNAVTIYHSTNDKGTGIIR